jgi:glucose-1-phosphate cytidylyltransferase
MIKDYFRNYLWNTCDTTLRLGRDPEVEFHNNHEEEDWSVTLADTGENSMTAFRIKQIERYIDKDDEFLLTYGDGVGDVDINASIAAHLKNGKICTLTAVHPPGRFGELALGTDSTVKSFNEKPQTEGGLINGGYMVCSRRIFKHLNEDPTVMFEQAPLKNLASQGELDAYQHRGFWQPMDTFQEFTMLNKMWESGRAPWKTWQ